MANAIGFNTVDSFMAPDTALANLEQRVRGELGNRVRHFQLMRDPTGLILKGRTQTYYAKQMAQQVVMRTSSEPIAANEIEVS